MARAMKDSGIVWIGEIPANWQIGRIGQLYTERREKVSDTEYQPLSVTMKGILPQLSTAAKTDAHDDRKLVRIGDFAINSRSDRRGSCGISPYEGSVSLINTILMPRNEMHPVYYNWLFHSTMFSDEFYKWGHGIVNDLWTTNWQDMKRIAVPIPSFEEQQRIADFLDAECARIDAVIEQTRASIEEYKKLKQAVITQAVTKGIRPGRKTKDSGVEWIGEIPEEWTVLRKLSYAVNKSISYGIVKLFDPDDISGVRVLRCSDVREGKIDTSNIRTVAKAVSDEYSRTLLEGGEVLINVRGTLGGCAVVPPEMRGYNIAREVAMISLTDAIINRYLMYYFLSKTFGTYEERHLAGSVYVGLNIEMLAACPVTLPPLPEQEHIADYLDNKCQAFDTVIAKKSRIIQELESYKKSLIFEYVTGKKEA